MLRVTLYYQLFHNQGHMIYFHPDVFYFGCFKATHIQWYVKIFMFLLYLHLFIVFSLILHFLLLLSFVPSTWRNSSPQSCYHLHNHLCCKQPNSLPWPQATWGVGVGSSPLTQHMPCLGKGSGEGWELFELSQNCHIFLDIVPSVLCRVFLVPLRSVKKKYNHDKNKLRDH